MFHNTLYYWTLLYKNGAFSLKSFTVVNTQTIYALNTYQWACRNGALSLRCFTVVYAEYNYFFNYLHN